MLHLRYPTPAYAYPLHFLVTSAPSFQIQFVQAPISKHDGHSGHLQEQHLKSNTAPGCGRSNSGRTFGKHRAWDSEVLALFSLYSWVCRAPQMPSWGAVVCLRNNEKMKPIIWCRINSFHSLILGKGPSVRALPGSKLRRTQGKGCIRVKLGWSCPEIKHCSRLWQVEFRSNLWKTLGEQIAHNQFSCSSPERPMTIRTKHGGLLWTLKIGAPGRSGSWDCSAWQLKSPHLCHHVWGNEA